jgi:hypothetical protein
MAGIVVELKFGSTTIRMRPERSSRRSTATRTGTARRSFNCLAHSQRVLQQSLHARRKLAFFMLADQRATAPQQMRETSLMDATRESPIRCPAVAGHHAGEVCPEYRTA